MNRTNATTKEGAEKTKYIFVRLSPSEKTVLKKLAEGNFRNMSEQIRYMILTGNPTSR